MKETSTLLEVRRKKLEECTREGSNPFPNDFTVSHTTGQLRKSFEHVEPGELEQVEEEFSLAGRVMSLRNFGKAAFIHIQDRTGTIQAYLQKDVLGDGGFTLAKKLDVGDFCRYTGTGVRHTHPGTYHQGRPAATAG